MSIQWRDQLSIDGSVIDSDHKMLIEIINKYEDAINCNIASKVIKDLLRSLYDYSMAHFKREEEFHVAVQYPFAATHKNEHRNLMRKLGEIIELYQDHIGTPDALKTSYEVARLLKDWLLNHIIGSDLRIRPYVDNMKKYERAN